MPSSSMRLDQRRFGVARRRLGEVLLDGDAVLGERIAGGHRRQAAVVAGRRSPRREVLGIVVAALLVDGEEAVEPDSPGRWRGARPCARRSPASMSTVVRSNSADAIWLATVRFQISS